MSKVVETVTFGIIAFNEHRYLPDTLDDLIKQTYPKKLIEVILVDGNSSDDTWQIMESFRNKHINDYNDVKLIHNPKRVQPAGWNLVIQNSTADLLLRIDAHARLPHDFVRNNVDCINSGENVCGGPRENIIDEDTLWKRMLLDAEQSMFGAGVASYRQETNEKKYVKSLFHGCYRREVLERVGLFNEELIRTEDNEYHYRIRKLGYNICYDPSIKSRYQTRNSLKGMIKQKYLNGLWIGKTLLMCPGCISVFHLIPFAFVSVIIASGVLLFFGIRWPAALVWLLYGITNVLMTIATMLHADRRNGYRLLLPVIFFLLHISYGFGTMVGIISR